MNLLQILDTVGKFSETNGIPLENIVVTHGAAMVLLGLAQEATDVDLTVDQMTFERFIEMGHPPINVSPTRILIQVSPDIDIHMDSNVNKPEDLFTTNGVRFTSMKRTYEDYLSMNRVKDKAKIDTLKRFLLEE